MKKVIAGILLLFSVSLLINGQTNFIIQKSIDWGNEKGSFSITEDKQKEFLFFKGASLDEAMGQLPVYFERFDIPAFGNIEINLSNTAYSPLQNPGLVGNPELLGRNPKIVAHVSIEKKKPFASVKILPLIRESGSGRIMRLESFDLEVKLIPEPVKSRRNPNAAFASNSVLAAGNWYKIATSSRGIYKLDYNYFQDNMGWDMNSIDPRNIKIYGNGGGMLPELNSEFRYDDLHENPAIMVGGSDGNFDQGDYILFYGSGPNKIKNKNLPVNSTDTLDYFYYLENNLYSNSAYYFINHSASAGKRIQTQNNPGAHNMVTSEFDHYSFHEAELHNVAESGREWFGEKFDFANLNQTFSFNIPDLITSEPVYVNTEVIGRTVNGSVGFEIKANNQTVSNYSFGKVGINYYDTFALLGNKIKGMTGMVSPINVAVSFLPSGSDPESSGWLNFININARRKLKLSSNQLMFRDSRNIGTGNITEFTLISSVGLTVLDITNPGNPIQVSTVKSGNEVKFSSSTDTLKEFIAFDNSGYLTPDYIGNLPNQDIHGSIGQPDVIIVSHRDFLSSANKLADFHRNEDGYDVSVVQLDKVYNEFSSGANDITAIRDLMRMLYERSTSDATLPQYLILLGDGSYDYKNIEIAAEVNHNFIPTYQSFETLDRSVTFTSDDYFGLLDDEEGTDIMKSGQALDIGIGRIVAITNGEANDIVNKIINYHNQTSYGSWRNMITFVADDEDSNTHIRDANDYAKYVRDNYPVLNIDKIYLDAFEQVSTAGGSRYPQVNQAINSRVFSGSLVLSYTGHGGESGWAHERILRFEDVNSWSNSENLPLFVTATCSFSRYDNPNRKSGGELLLTKPDGGAIGLVTTVRLVYSSQNDVLNTQLFKKLFNPVNGEMPTLGEVMTATKNGISGNANNRKFTLLGDPAMKIGYPDFQVSTKTIQGKPYSKTGDTLKALTKITITGQVEDYQGNRLDNFNGVVYPTIFDKSKNITTLKNDPKSNYYTFDLQKNIIYKGKASVTQGDFAYSFIVPKDIAYNLGFGKISYYANDMETDANGFDSILIGGSATSFPPDDKGPEVSIYMNDEKFAFGGITDENPLMLVKLSDENGINTAGSAIGHDITAVIDEEDNNKIILNEFYEAGLDDYTIGEVRYPLSNLSEGRYKVKVKAWDVYNNSGEGYTEFVVAKSAKLALSHVLNYPNPFTTNTSFWFEHNRPGELLNVQVRIYTVSGKVVKTIDREILSEGYRVDDIEWDGLDDYGDKIGKGIYVYKVSVRAEDGEKADQFEKLVILQ